MKCSRCEFICKEWAADFRKLGFMGKAGLWDMMALVFRGIEVCDNGVLEYVIRNVELKIAMREENLVIAAGDKRRQDAMNKIHEEALFILPKLYELQGNTCLY